MRTVVSMGSARIALCAAMPCCVPVAHRRQEPIIAIGGGVCLDVAGLAANLYRRNTCIIKVGV